MNNVRLRAAVLLAMALMLPGGAPLMAQSKLPLKRGPQPAPAPLKSDLNLRKPLPARAPEAQTKATRKEDAGAGETRTKEAWMNDLPPEAQVWLQNQNRKKEVSSEPSKQRKPQTTVQASTIRTQTIAGTPAKRQKAARR